MPSCIGDNRENFTLSLSTFMASPISSGFNTNPTEETEQRIWFRAAGPERVGPASRSLRVRACSNSPRTRDTCAKKCRAWIPRSRVRNRVQPCRQML